MSLVAAPPTATAQRLILRGDLLDFTADPGFAAPDESPGVRWREDHAVLIEDGRITGVQPFASFEQGLPAGWGGIPVQDHRGRLLLPGFIDTHVHAPQLDVIASYGTELLDWLNTYTFPAERRALPERPVGQRHDQRGGFPDRAQGQRRSALRGRPCAEHAPRDGQSADEPLCPRRPA
jgi:cytosine/adenosine deaminase-related metal-dependent hydrolase